MRSIQLFVALMIICTSSILAYADGTYYIGRDEGGVYFQSDQDGGWYIDEEDMKYFRIGDKGTYLIKTDFNGTYIKTDKHKKFYIDLETKKQLENEVSSFNQQQQKLSVQSETKVTIKGNQVLVPVIMGYGGKEIEAMLLLDTGASIVAVHAEVADRLNIKQTQKARFQVAGGEIISTHITKLNYVKVGPFEKKDIYAGIIEHTGPSVAHHGLLGMNFLHDLKYHVDFKRQLLIWEN